MTGEILQDKKKNGKDRGWSERRMRTDLLSESLLRLKMSSRAARTSDCSRALKYMECPTGHYKKLVHANFCRDRMCPMCNWRRSLKLQGQIMQIVHEAVNRRKMRFIILTLTVVNVSGENLSETMTEMLKGFNLLMKYVEVDKQVLGFVRNFEVTYNKDRNDFHPHIHVLLAVKPEYFKSGYIRQSKWTDMWQRAVKADYRPRVDVRTVKPNREGQTLEGAAMEVGKYCAKDTDYIHKGDNDLTDNVVYYLSNALNGRRLLTFGRLFRQIHKELHLQDIESKTADLIGASEHSSDCPICNSNLAEQIYNWFYAYKVYIGE